ncbi:Chitin-inducible gibberellin-responsive protein 1 [Vitis vinifera]|uniref:Chitin-inducible gibberellin-responsive protein 1 n=1 Tax=Vitis vinifera TaxID=29760 RepID=A0A438IDB9_VITVI|nr:Chitin-inducible gibberellin-responsive protein 1 [Vitis vinifera]
MDSRQIFGYSVTGADLSFTSSHPTVPSIPNRLFGSLKFDLGNSPNSPFSNLFDCDTLTTFSDSQEQHSSTENLSELSASCSSVETNSYFNHLSPSVGCRRDSLQGYSSGTSLLQNASPCHNIKHALLELESALMAPDADEVTTPSPSLGEDRGPQIQVPTPRAWSQEAQGSLVLQPQPSFSSSYRKFSDGVHIEKRQKAMEEGSLQSNPPGNLKELLIECARALSENRLDDFKKLVEKARGAVSISGEPIQRLGAYLVEGLVARTEASGNNIYHALRCREPESKDLLSYMQILYEICPYLKFGYMAANGAIAEACRNEDRIHIIDFQIAQGTQWVTLLQALAARPSGAPRVRITGIDDPVNKYARGAGLDAVGKRLAAISEKFKIPVEFHPVPVFAPDITQEMLDVRPGEALAVNFPLQLHHTPDESVDVNNPRDELLRMVKSLSPKVTTLERKERINVEQHCLARDIVNIIACEGKERVERHELFGKWKSRALYLGGKGWGNAVGVEGQELGISFGLVLTVRIGDVMTGIEVAIENGTDGMMNPRQYENGNCYFNAATAKVVILWCPETDGILAMIIGAMLPGPHRCSAMAGRVPQ